METDTRLLALNRFGLGARPGERTTIDPSSWLSAQVRPDAALLTGSNLPTTAAIATEAVTLLGSESQSGRCSVQ